MKLRGGEFSTGIDKINRKLPENQQLASGLSFALAFPRSSRQILRCVRDSPKPGLRKRGAVGFGCCKCNFHISEISTQNLCG
jgi:hypothetical protein